MTQYPTSISPEAIGLVTGLLLGNVPDKPKAIHAGWDTAGYIMGIVFPEAVTGNPFPPGMTPMPPQDAVAAISKLGNHPTSSAQAALGGGFNWLALLLAIIQAIGGQLGK